MRTVNLEGGQEMSVVDDDSALDESSGNTHNFIVGAGQISAELFSEVAVKVVLSAEDEANIARAQKILDQHLSQLQNLKSEYIKIIRVLDLKGEKISPLALAKYNKILADIKDEALNFIEYLSGKGALLFKEIHYERSEELFLMAINYLKRIYGQNHANTLRVQMDYEILLVVNKKSPSVEQLEKIVLSLEEGLIGAESRKAKKAVAIGKYILAQYYHRQKKSDLALKFLDDSEVLRHQYGASEQELDRVRFLRARLLAESDSAAAMPILLEVYRYRMHMGEMSSDLIPVLEELINIEEDKFKLLNYLGQLLNLKKHYEVDPRSIINTQFQLFKVVVYKISEDERWNILNELEAQLDDLPVTEESADVGINYSRLADIRLSQHLPQAWSITEKIEFHSKTLIITEKGLRHLNGLADYNAQLEARFLEGLKQKCLIIIDSFRRYPRRLLSELLTMDDRAAIEAEEYPVETAESGFGAELDVLSLFSSEAHYSIIAESERVLSVAEFEALPEEGIINPFKLRVAQGGVSPEFSDGKSLKETEGHLVFDPNYTRGIPPIEIGVYKGKVHSFDTRRLIVHMKAKELNPMVYVRYKKISGKRLAERAAAIHSDRPWNGLVTAERYGGKNSESRPYINPLYRSQLEEKVSRSFKFFPNDRKGADSNGFPLDCKQAEKIHNFLKKKRQDGSKLAADVLHKASAIFKSEGKESAYRFLIELRSRTLPDSAGALLSSVAEADVHPAFAVFKR